MELPPVRETRRTSKTRKIEQDVLDEEEDQEERKRKKPRKELTQNACWRCRNKKSKCDGKRPVCARCKKDGAECVFDVLDGMTRMQNLQHKLDTTHEDCRRLSRLLEAFRTSTDYEATSLLARFRLGESIEDLVTSLEPASVSVPQSQQYQPQRRGTFPFTQLDWSNASSTIWQDDSQGGRDAEFPVIKRERSSTLDYNPP